MSVWRRFTESVTAQTLRSERPEDRFIESEQIRLFYKASVRTPYALMLLLAVLAWFMSENIPVQWPFLWAVAVAALYINRGMVTRRALARNLDDDSLRRHCRFVYGLTILGAAVAGLGILAFFGRLPPERQAIITMLCIGWISAAVGISSVYPRFFTGYVAAFGGSLLAAWIFFGYDHRWTIALLLSFLFLYLWRAAKEIGDKAVESIRIRFERIELLKQLEARQRETEEASEAKSRFMAAASHDLRQPLMSLNLLYGSLLRAPTHEAAMSIARKLNAPVLALEAILDSLVEISKLDAGAVSPHKDLVEVERFGVDIQEEFAPRAMEAGIGWKVSASPGLAVFDAHLAARLLRNLVDNAFKFTEAGRVGVTLRSAGGNLSMVVEDTGCGISPAYRDRIFDEYFQVDNPTRSRARGMGLGLAIVRRLVHLLGGTIRVDSEIGAGTVFTVDLPLGEPADFQASLLLPESDDRHDASIRPLQVLFVEDESSVQDAIATWAEVAHAHALYASDASEALRIAAEIGDAIDIVVSDYRLPGPLNGLELIAALREVRKDMAAILLTGDASSVLAGQARAAGVSFMTKPVSIDRLEAEIQRTLEMRSRTMAPTSRPDQAARPA